MIASVSLLVQSFEGDPLLKSSRQVWVNFALSQLSITDIGYSKRISITIVKRS